MIFYNIILEPKEVEKVNDDVNICSVNSMKIECNIPTIEHRINILEQCLKHERNELSKQKKHN